MKSFTQLESHLESLSQTHTQSARTARQEDRLVRDLQSQLDRRAKSNTQLTEEIASKNAKIQRLLSTIDDLAADDSKNQLAARRAERDLREEREERARLEREVEGWKNLRVERGLLGSVAARIPGSGSRVGSLNTSVGASSGLVPGGGTGTRSASYRTASHLAALAQRSESSPAIGTASAGNIGSSGSGERGERSTNDKAEGVRRQLSNSKVLL